MSKVDQLNKRIVELEKEVTWLHRERREVYAERDKLEYLLTPRSDMETGVIGHVDDAYIPENMKPTNKNYRKHGRYHSTYDN